MQQIKEILEVQDKMIDELLDGLKELAHKKLREAYNSGAIDLTEYNDITSYILPKLIVTLVCESGQYYPLASEHKKELKNLKKFI